MVEAHDRLVFKPSDNMGYYSRKHVVKNMCSTRKWSTYRNIYGEIVLFEIYRVQNSYLFLRFFQAARSSGSGIY